MANLTEYEQYMNRLCEKLGHAERRAGIHGMRAWSDAVDQAQQR